MVEYVCMDGYSAPMMLSARGEVGFHDREQSAYRRLPSPSRLLSVSRLRSRCLYPMDRLRQPPSTPCKPDLLRRPEHSVRQKLHKAHMPLIPPRDLQPLYRAPMVLRTHIPLRTVLVHESATPTGQYVWTLRPLY